MLDVLFAVREGVEGVVSRAQGDDSRGNRGRQSQQVGGDENDEPAP